MTAAGGTDPTATVSPVLRSATTELRLPATTLAALAVATATRVPDVEAVVDLGSGKRHTHGQVLAEAQRVAGGLARDGVLPGDRIAVHLPNGAPWCVAVLGVWLAGAVLVPVNTRFSPDEVDHVVTDSGAVRVLADPAALPDADPTPPHPGDADDLAAIFYTSGTTGRPKGAMLPHRALLAAAEQCRLALGLDPGERTRSLVAAPLFHILATAMQWLPALASGGAVVIQPTFEPAAWIAAIRDEHVDLLNGVPAMFFAALRHPDFATLDSTHVRRLSYGAAPTPPAQVRALREAFPAARMAPGYGLTEAACVTGLDHEDTVAHADSVGTAVAATELALRPTPGGPEDTGVLLVRGPQVFDGYWQQPHATAEVLTDDGWLSTGDMVRIDEGGRVHMLDRRTDMINRGGENVYSVEVERALSAVPGVAEVAVVAVPDDMMGSKVGAVVVPGPETNLSELPSALLEHARDALADFKVPQFLALRHEPLPRNSGGKVVKAALRAESAWTPVGRTTGDA
jgi:acyl-CoA synthetase (AMP-forming)/AMP-acid ligase II